MQIVIDILIKPLLSTMSDSRIRRTYYTFLLHVVTNESMVDYIISISMMSDNQESAPV